MSPQRLFIFLFLIFSTTLFSQGAWTQKAYMPGYARHRPFTFSVGSRGYLGCGWNGVIMYQDVWEYDPGTDSWMQKADYPAGPRLSPFGFAIANKGYVGCGLDEFLYVHNDFFEYNPATNIWTPKAAFSGTPIFAAATAVVNNKGYVMFGDDWDLGYWRHNEVYTYTPSTNTWAYLTTCPADGRRDPVAFQINNKIYIGLGSDNSYMETDDWWEYNPATGVWTQKASYAGTPRSQAVGFAVMGKGYVGTGGQLDEQDFFEYDVPTNSWQSVDLFPGQGRENSATFVIGNLAYLSCGTSGTNYHDCWEFNPLHITGLNENKNPEITSSVFPNPLVTNSTLKLNGNSANSENQFSLYSPEGKLVSAKTFSGNEFEISRENLSSGTYIYVVETGGKRIANGKLNIE